ncbi:MAG: glycosyltransferase family 4 protein [Bacteroidaceae bacterium]|nr:glycosyltransferase family 4 protein [Bacteroidaceae bacterium]
MKKEIWGFYPPPLGGISMYCKRLSQKMHEKDSTVVLRNFAASKSDKDFVIDVPNRVWEFVRLLFAEKRLIHSQFTNIYMLLLLYLFGWRHPLIMTLHNRRIVLLNGWKRFIVNRLFRRAKYIIYNDSNYTAALQEKYDIDTDKVVILPTYISPLPDEHKGLTPEIEEFCNRHRYTMSSNAHTLVKNVFGDVYGLDQQIELMNRLVNRDAVDVGLIFCIAEVHDDSYYNECVARIKELNLMDNFLFLIKSPVNGFEVWKRTDLFLRPTMSDMEGISVKEALEFGTPVVASDVCVRPREAVLYKKADVDDLYEKVSAILKEQPRVSYNPEVSVPDEILSIYDRF